MSPADALTAARWAGFTNARAALIQLLMQHPHIDRAAMLTAWRAGRTLAAAGLTWRRPRPPCTP